MATSFPNVRGAALALLITGLIAPGASAQHPAPTTSPADGQGSFQPLVSHPDVAALASEATEETTGTPDSPRSEPPRMTGVSVAGRLGVSLTETSGLSHGWVSHGYNGHGVKVGIIDYFDPAVLGTQAAAGALPTIAADHRRCFDHGAICPFGGPGNTHGNAIAEVIHLESPGAELFLAEVGVIGDYYAALDWFAANGVTIVNHSLEGVYDGPGDGTGPAAAVVDYSVAKGMAFFTSTGDAAPDTRYSAYQGGYWSGVWNDPDSDRWLNFKGGDEYLGTYCGALMGLRWSDWGASRTDYELWISDMKISTGSQGVPMLASNADQTLGAQPLEGNDFRWLCNTNTAYGPVYDKNKDGFVSLMVRRSTKTPSAGAAGDVMEIQVLSGWFEYSMGPSSAAIAFADSKNPGAVAVSSQEYFPSQGPTKDNRIKPDLTAPSCYPNSISGNCSTGESFVSSEMSTAMATGIAANARSGLGDIPPVQLVQYLKSNAPWTVGRDYYGGQLPVLPNNTNGWGQIRLRGNGPVLPEVEGLAFQPYGARIVDTRQSSIMRPSTAPLAPGTSLSIKIPTFAISESSPPVVVLNVTVVKPIITPSWVEVFPGAAGVPGTTSNLNVQQPGQNVANVVVARVGPEGDVIILDRPGGHIVVDYLGYFSAEAWNSQRFNPVNTFRAYTSRCAQCTPLPAGTARDVQIAGTGDPNDPYGTIPPEVAALSDRISVVVSVTADAPSAAGYISALTAGEGVPPGTSTANFQAGRSVSGLSIVRLGSEGKIRVFSSVTTNFQVDVLGYFATDLNPGGLFTPVPAKRVLDTRPGAPPAAGLDNVIGLAAAGVPDSAAAVLTNLTTAGSTGIGVMKLAMDSSAVDATYANLSIDAPGLIASAAAISRAADGTVTVTSDAPAHRIVDVFGWFSPISRDSTGPLTAAPIDASAPATAATGVGVSPDAHLVAFYEGQPGPGRLRIWDRISGSVTTLDITPGETDLMEVNVEAISDDGTRLMLTTFDPNLTPDDAPVTFDRFYIDIANDTITRLGHLGDGTQYGFVAVDADVTKMWITTSASLDPSDVDVYIDLYEVDLATGATQLIHNGPGFWYSGSGPMRANTTLDSAWIAGSLWTRSGGIVPNSSGRTPISFSDDGHYAVTHVVAANPSGYQMTLFDLTTSTETVLCDTAGPLWEQWSVDWSQGVPTSGSWCSANSSYAVLSGNVLNTIAPSWTGSTVGWNKYPVATRNGVSVYLGSGIMPGGLPQFWVFVHENVHG